MTEMLEVRTAYDHELIEEIPLEPWEKVDAKLATAARLFADRDAWLPAHERIAILKKLTGLLDDAQDEFAMLIAREGGKPLTDARAEAARAVNGIEIAIEEIGKLTGNEIAMGLTPAAAGRRAFTIKEPIGPVVAISAFNHPLNLIVHQVVPAIATGCPVIVKPAGTTPLSCLRFVELVHQAGLDPDWCQTVNCDIPTAEKMVTDPRVAFFTFIGSGRVGWHLRSKLAPGTRCALEHGGAAPVIVDESADLDTLIEPLVKGGYYHAGQVCVSVQRIFVHESLIGGFSAAFTDRVSALRAGDPTLAETESGPLIQPREVDRVRTWVDEAVAGGATLMTGGKALSDTVYQPTVLLDPAADASVSTNEIFGPVTCIYPYSDMDEAIARANSVPFSFQAAVFSENVNRIWRAAERLNAAAVMVNDHTAFRVDWMPFAGRKQSGYGIGGIPYTMEDMVEDKMVVFREG